MLGISMGWVIFALYIIYAVGFTFGSILMHNDGQARVTANDVIVVSFMNIDCFSD